VRIYLASPNTQQQAEHVAGMSVLVSFACHDPWLDQYIPTFEHLLIDSGAYSELSGGERLARRLGTSSVDPDVYREWAERWRGHADAIAGLDDIRGDWRRSLRNYAAMPFGFPTFHDSDPWELLPELVAMARERGNWIGIGLVPPRAGKETFIRRVCDALPDDLHVHGWALRAYTRIRRLDSVDSTSWFRVALDVRAQLPWLTYGECLAIVVKRYQRWNRLIVEPGREQQVLPLEV
jgi:hypothetical protein